MEKIVFDKIKNQRIFEQIIAKIGGLVIEGKLKSGDQLPSERDISEMMGVHRHSVREALKVLEYMGVLESKAGQGTVITNPCQEILVSRILRASKFCPKNFLFELIELRQALEPVMCRLAAERATEKDLHDMEEAVDDLKMEIEKGEYGISADERLHIAIAKATYNDTFLRMTEPIMKVISEYRIRSLKKPGRRSATYIEHREIYFAIKNCRPKQAELAMQKHLKNIRDMLEN